ncbi:MAG: V-type ATP synthase subunit D [Candidatus Omnitrophota bacterium]
MSKIRLTKGELKRQRDSLEQYQHYLPTLQLKKQQLQTKILDIKQVLARRQAQLDGQERTIGGWAGVLADERVDIQEWVLPKKIVLQEINIAGANIPVFKEVIFAEAEYDFYLTPLWVDQGLKHLRAWMALLAEIEVLQRQVGILSHELRVTTQRVNLFEKVKIPEAVDNIRKIRIYLGDQLANAVGISKVAKKKIQYAAHQEMFV